MTRREENSEKKFVKTERIEEERPWTRKDAERRASVQEDRDEWRDGAVDYRGSLALESARKIGKATRPRNDEINERNERSRIWIFVAHLHANERRPRECDPS